MTCGAASDWRFLHDGSDFTMAVVYRVPSTASAITPIVDTLANDVANVGFGLYHDAASAAHSFQAKIGNDTAAVINHDSQDYGSRPDAWHIAMISRESGAQSTEEQYQVYLDNENYASFDQSNTPIAATNPAGTLTIGGLAGGGTFGRIDIKAIAIWDRKLSRPDETMLANQILAKQLATSHVALAAGNGLANILNQTEYLHRGFPGLVKTSQGHWLCTYRRASAHGSSTGVCCAVTSGDGIVWSQERVIIDDSANFDWRGVNFLGEFSGRLFLGGRWATVSTSGLIPYTTHIWYSDDGGGSWTGPVYLSKSTDGWFQGLFNGELDHDEGLNSIVQLGDGSLLAHFCALVDGGVFRHLVQCRSYDLGETWTEPEVVYYGRATGSAGDFPADENIQEPVCIRFADGELLLAIRSEDTNHRIYFARSTDDGATWTPGTFTTEYQAVWGNPRMAIDPNDPDAVYMWIRNGSAGLLTNWIYSDDRGATWSALRRFANLTSTTTIQGYTQFDYAFPAVDEDGNVWVAYALNRGGDCDVFVQRWSNAE